MMPYAGRNAISHTIASCSYGGALRGYLKICSMYMVQYGRLPAFRVLFSKEVGWIMCCSLLEESPCRKLFETGLELSLARLKALTKFAIGMGLTQVILVTPIGESSLGEGRVALLCLLDFWGICGILSSSFLSLSSI
ncbi:hypothetical protein Gotur_029396 [Gossypium turneri]